MKEIWKNVVGYEGLYEVSNLGRVKRVESLVTRKDGVSVSVKSRIINPTNKKYSQISLSKNGVNKTKYIANLVAEAFISNPNNYKYVLNINENNCDNSVGNLEWSETKKSYRTKLSERYVNYIKENKENLSIEELASMFNVNDRTIKMYMNETT